MMVLAIIAFAIETVFLIVVNTLTQMGSQLSLGFSWFAVFVFVICTLLAILALIGSIKEIRSGWSKAKGIVGTVFAGLALLIGAIFLITFVTALFAALAQSTGRTY